MLWRRQLSYWNAHAEAFELTLDGYFGMALSLLIMYTGFSTAKESVNLLVGISADPELVKQIETLLLSVRGVKGAHELRVHDYGPGRTFASVHAEVDPEASFVDTHAEIDKIEERIAEELGVKIAHMDRSCQRRRNGMGEDSYDIIWPRNTTSFGKRYYY